MRCASCMTVNTAGNRFCENCGTQFKQTCGQCGHECLPSARFCGACGHSLVAAAGAEEAKPVSQWGELKQATVLFADIAGSTEHIAGLDPEQAMGQLRPAIIRMCNSVERFGGTVVRTLGDGVMALFGVPLAMEGHALLACEAALDMQQAFARDVPGLKIRVGLHSGQVASDPDDANGGRGGGAHGLTIHVASRVVSLAEPGGICLTAACQALVANSCEVRPLGLHALKGIGGQTSIYALVGLAHSGARQPVRETVLTPFRGREREMAQLQQALQGAERGDTRVVGISAQPGGGKSRLCHEFVQYCRARNVPVCEVRTQLYGHATPLQPVLELLRTFFFGITLADSADVARTRIARRVSRLGTAGPTDQALLCEFLGVARPDEPPSELSPKVRHLRLLGIVRDFIRQDAHVPAVVLIEDLHWMDEASEEFVTALVDAMAGTRTLMVLNYRPAYRSPWAMVPHFVSMELPELGDADMHALVTQLLGRSDLAEICQLIVERSAGNPFFAEELVRTLAEGNYLPAGGGLPAGGLEAVERALPATVEALIGARLDRLGEPEKTLLQMCAIIGKEIPLAVLSRVASPLAAVLEKGVDGLCRAELILPQPTTRGRRFTFRHPLIQEVAYNSQLKMRRAPLHSAVAQAMETYYAEQLDEYSGLIAYHYEAANRSLDAAIYSARAARWVGATDSARSIKHWRKVWTLLESHPRAPQSDRLRAMAGAQISWLGWREGFSLEEAQPFIQEAVGLAAEGDVRLVQLLLLVEGRILQGSGGPADRYAELVSKALSLGTPETDMGRMAILSAALSHAYAWAGLLNEGLAANDMALQGLDSIDKLDREFVGFSVEQWTLSIRVRLLNRMGRFDEARQYLDRMPLDAQTSDDPVMRQLAHHVYVDHAWCKGDAALASRYEAPVATVAEKHSNPYSKVFALWCKGTTGLTAGNFGTARGFLAEALALIRSTGVAVDFESEILAGLAECELRLGRWADAVATAQEAVRTSRLRSNRIAECRALIAWGAALSEGVGTASPEAHELFEQARRLIGVTGAVILEGPLQQAMARVELPAR